MWKYEEEEEEVEEIAKLQVPINVLKTFIYGNPIKKQGVCYIVALPIYIKTYS
jgi:hypothetical protein